MKPETRLINAIFHAFREDEGYHAEVEGVSLREALMGQLDRMATFPGVRRAPVLCDRYKPVILLRFGFEDGSCHTLEDTGKRFGRSRERIRQIEGRTLRIMRHPAISQHLRPFIKPEA